MSGDNEVRACLRRRTQVVGAQRERVPAYVVRQVNGMRTRLAPVSSPLSYETEANNGLLTACPVHAKQFCPRFLARLGQQLVRLRPAFDRPRLDAGRTMPYPRTRDAKVPPVRDPRPRE